MNRYRTVWHALLGSALLLLAACQTQRPADRDVVVSASNVSHVRLELPEAWGGEVRCGAGVGSARGGAGQHLAFLVEQLKGDIPFSRAIFQALGKDIHLVMVTVQ